MNFDDLGKWLVLAGIVFVLLGGLMWLLGRIPFFGNLPGDIRIQTQNVSCFILILNIIIRIVNK